MRNNRRLTGWGLVLLSVALCGTSWAQKKGGGDKEAMAEAAKAVQLAQQGAYDQAVAGFTKAINLSPKDDRLYKDRGSIYLTLQKFPEAVADFAKAIELNPKNDQAIRGAGPR